jgi:hypothetical protein
MPNNPVKPATVEATWATFGKRPSGLRPAKALGPSGKGIYR